MPVNKTFDSHQVLFHGGLLVPPLRTTWTLEFKRGNRYEESFTSTVQAM